MVASIRTLVVALCALGACAFTPQRTLGRVLQPRSASAPTVRMMSDFQSADEIERTAAKLGLDMPEVYEDPKQLVFPDTKYFFGRVTVGLGPGMKPISDVLAPAFKDDTSALGVVEVPLPMGMVFEESETLPGKFEVIEVVEGGNAEKAGVRAGDVLRGTTAMAVNAKASMDTLDDQLIEADAFKGKVGLQRALFMADGQPFDALMGALVSNSAEQKGPEVATLVIERSVREVQPRATGK